MTDKKHPLDDFFAGNTGKCNGFFTGCGNRLTSLEAEYCDKCLEEKNKQEFKLEFARLFEARKSPNCIGAWYMSWSFTLGEFIGEYFICLSCGDRKAQREYGVPGSGGFLTPATICCTNRGCKMAMEFWGGNIDIANMKLGAYAHELRARIDMKLTSLRDLRAYRS